MTSYNGLVKTLKSEANLTSMWVKVPWSDLKSGYIWSGFSQVGVICSSSNSTFEHYPPLPLCFVSSLHTPPSVPCDVAHPTPLRVVEHPASLLSHTLWCIFLVDALLDDVFIVSPWTFWTTMASRLDTQLAWIHGPWGPHCHWPTNESHWEVRICQL